MDDIIVPTGDGDDGYSIPSVIGDIVTGVPAPIRKNFFKVCGRLMTALADYPVAALQGRASERRAESEARVKIIEASGEQIAQRLEVDPEFYRAASIKFAEKIVREQVNLNKVTEVAARQLAYEASQNSTQDEDKALPPVDEDWMNNFEAAAKLKSSDDMHKLFGKILSAEVQHPSSFSIRTVNLVSELSQHAALVFQNFCSLSVSTGRRGTTDVRVCSLGGRAGSNVLKAYGLPYNSLNLLQEYGLLVPDYECWFEYVWSPEVDGRILDVPFYHQGRPWGLRPSNNKNGLLKSKVTGPALSRAGKELFRIVDLKQITAYTQALMDYFARQGVTMIPLQEH